MYLRTISCSNLLKWILDQQRMKRINHSSLICITWRKCTYLSYNTITQKSRAHSYKSLGTRFGNINNSVSCPYYFVICKSSKDQLVRWPPFHCWQWFGGAPSSAFINLVMLLRVLLGLSPPIRGVANEPSTPKPLLAMVKGLHQFTFC